MVALQMLDVIPEELELFVLSSLKTVEQIHAAKASGLRRESFQVSAHALVWDYLQHKAVEGDAPTMADVRAVTGVDLYDELTDVKTYQEELVRRTAYRLAVAAILRQQDNLADNPPVAIETLIGDLSDVVQQNVAHNRFFMGGAAARWQRVQSYAQRVAAGGTLGFRTGLPVMDEAGDAWRPGELVCIQGPLNVGKSTLLLWFCAQAFYYDNARVLFLSPEMTIDEVELRLDPMLANFMGLELRNSELRTGHGDQVLQGDYYERLQAMGRDQDWATRDSGDAGYFTVQEIVRLAREFRPDLLAIDGMHLIRGRGKSWESMKEASELLKGLGQNQGMVILGCTQVQRDAVIASDDTADLSQSAYGMAMLEAADKVISVAEKRGDPLERVWKLPKNRLGKKITMRQFLRFDVDTGRIGDLHQIVQEETGDVVEEIVL